MGVWNVHLEGTKPALANAADSALIMPGVQLTQLQDGIIETAYSEGQVDPATFARLLLQDLDYVHAAISDLVDQGLVAATEDGAYHLTEQGEAARRAHESAHRAGVASRIRSWQRG